MEIVALVSEASWGFYCKGSLNTDACFGTLMFLNTEDKKVESFSISS